MRLSEFHAQIRAAGVETCEAYALWLAAPDKDGFDVDLASVGRVDIQYEIGEIRLYPASTGTDTASVDPEPVLGMMLSQLPSQAGFGNDDPRILVEIPLLRDNPQADSPSLAELQAVHIGSQSQEVWLLVRPAAEFAEGLLPD
ncbi:MAG TPA: hypothetical protein VN660_14580 [Steroidobacteraceae bacterium]|nr:hypothetical protein [Steroidobacteraceae bacterium]